MLDRERPVRAVLALLAIVTCVLAMSCSGGNAETGGNAATSEPNSPATGATATPTATPEDEVLAAYFRYWDAYSKALLEVDARLVEGVAGGEELRRIQTEVAELKALGRAARVVTTHKPVVIEVTSTSARLLDEMVNNSFYVDPVTKDPPIASGSGEVLRDTFYLELMNGRWLVTRSTRTR
jgi:hypothetical protein